ncbi:hypothetical protein ACWCYZ_05740 [Streptomyces virginiae]
MRRVTLHTLYAGPDRSVAAGQTAEFDDEEAARLTAGGYGVYADAPRRKSAAAEDKPVEKMSVAQLQAYAADHGIDVGDARTKAEILAAVEAAREAEAEA